MNRKYPLFFAMLAIQPALFAGDARILGGTANNGGTPPASVTTGEFTSGAIATSANAIVAVKTDAGATVLIGGTTQATVDTAGNSMTLSSGYVTAQAPAGGTLTIQVGSLTLTLTNGASVAINSQASGQISLAVIGGSVNVSGPGGASTIGSPGYLASDNGGSTTTSTSPASYDTVTKLPATERIPLQLTVGEATRLAIAHDSVTDGTPTLFTALSDYITSIYNATLVDFNEKRNDIDFYFKENQEEVVDEALKDRTDDPTLVISGN